MMATHVPSMIVVHLVDVQGHKNPAVMAMYAHLICAIQLQVNAIGSTTSPHVMMETSAQMEIIVRMVLVILAPLFTPATMGIHAQMTLAIHQLVVCTLTTITTLATATLSAQPSVNVSTVNAPMLLTTM